MPKQKANWIVDAGLFIGFLTTFFLDWTGVGWHQWLGIFLAVLALYHLLTHWRWVAAVTRRFLTKTSPQSRLYYLLDWVIFLSFLLIGFSGLWISTWLDLDLANYFLWKDLHVYSSIASLVLILLKIGMHWRWIVKTARAYFGIWKTPSPAAAAASASRGTQSASLNRREFLQLMGLAGLASLLSAANLVDFSQAAGQSILEDQTTAPGLLDTKAQAQSAGEASCQVICDRGCTYPGQCRRYIDQNGNGICDLTECQPKSSESQSAGIAESYPEDLDASSSETDLSALAPGQDGGDCAVICPQGCAYPGTCRDYIDQNGNGLCDLGECLESNTSMDYQTDSHSGGGGRRRRGKQ